MQLSNPDQNDIVLTAGLLPDIESTENDESIWGAVFNISTPVIGAGVMSIPATIKILGIIPGFITLLSIAILIEITAEFMLRFTQSGQAHTYASLMGDVLCGNESGETLHLGILEEWFGIHWWNTRSFALLFIVLFVILPVLSLRRIDSLKYTSAISVLLVLVFIAISSSMAISAMWQGKTQKIRLFPDFSNQSSIFDLFTTIPVFVTGSTIHIFVHPIRAELGKPSNMRKAIRISLLFCVAIYFAIGTSCYLFFGDSVMPDILVNFDQNSDTHIGRLLNDIVRLSYAVHLILVFPMMNFCLRTNLDELLFPKRPMLALDTPRFMCLTCVILGLTYLTAIGSTSIACISFVFPGFIILRDIHGISTIKDRIIAILVIIMAVGTSSIAIYQLV